MTETEIRAQLDRAVLDRNTSIMAGLLAAVGLRLYANDGMGPAHVAAYVVAAVAVLAWHAWHWRRVVRLRKRLGLDWRGRPLA